MRRRPGDDGVVPRSGTSLVVGVHPANPTNTVFVRYRVDGGVIQTVPGKEIRTDYERRAQYFWVAFPPFPPVKSVEYAVIVAAAAVRFRHPMSQTGLPRSFGWRPRSRRSSRPPFRPPAPAARNNVRRRLGFRRDRGLHFDPPQFIGETAGGMRINFLCEKGPSVGRGQRKGARGDIGPPDRATGRDGVVRIRAALALDDGG